MNPLPQNPELEMLARHTVWFKHTAEAQKDPFHLIAHVLTYGTYADVVILRKYVSDGELREALAYAPPGVFDPRSWAYRHLKLDQYSAPPLPERRFAP